MPCARILKLLGEELISDDVVAVSELVKNAHDADALCVTIRFRNVTGDQGEIEVLDDGCGMDREMLLGRWMQPAASTKVQADRKVTPRGRRVLGEKGVGRFAADKLARNLELFSRSKGSKDEIRAVIDWNQFDDGDRMLSDVKSQWEEVPARIIRKHGTLLRMTGLRTKWNERMFRRLSIRLGRLHSPLQERDPFVIRIESDEFPEYSGELRSDIVEKAPYRIEALFDGDQTITLGPDRTCGIQQRWNGQGELSCGPVRIRLLAFDLEGEALARIGPRMEVRAWLKEWTGVSIYRDGFRIWPYGEPHDDWLRLDQRRVNNPVEHLSNNQIIGFIDIGRDANPDLMDQTNREGLMNNRAFEDLRRLTYFVLQVLEAERQSVRHPLKRTLSANGTRQGESGSISSELERIAQQAGKKLGADLRQLRRKLEEQQKQEQAQQTRLVEGYFGLATVGQMAAGILPILPHETARIQADLQSLRQSLAGLNGEFLTFKRMSDSMSRLFHQLQFLQLAAGTSDRRRAIDLVSEIEAFQRSAEPLLHSREVTMQLDYPAREVFRTEMRPEHFHCLMQILTSNSLDWLSEFGTRKIRVTLSADDEICELIFSDTGPGIPFRYRTRVFDPKFSLKEDGRGMGLAIARRLLEVHGGKIQLLVDGRRKGANFRVVLPRKRSRATFQAGK